MLGVCAAAVKELRITLMNWTPRGQLKSKTLGGIMKSFRELRVWQKGMDLVERVYLLTREFPKQETYGLTSQVRRAGVSIPSNIAEGHTREHLK